MRRFGRGALPGAGVPNRSSSNSERGNALRSDHPQATPPQLQQRILFDGLKDSLSCAVRGSDALFLIVSSIHSGIRNRIGRNYERLLSRGAMS